MKKESNASPLELDEGQIRVALGDPDTPGLVLFTIALYNFGDEVLGNPEEDVDPLDPALLWAELHSKYGTWITEPGENKLNAIMTGLRGGMFWTDFDVFLAVATALFNGDLGDLINSGFEELTSTEIMWAMLEMELAWDADDPPPFSMDIQQYVEDMLAMEVEDQDANIAAVEKEYILMLEQFRELGVPASMIRAWDEEYAEVMEEIAEGDIQ